MAPKGNQVLGVIRRNITYWPKDNSLIVPLYKAIVRPHLEWSPYLRKDIDRPMHEKIQRRATKLIPGLRDLRLLCRTTDNDNDRHVD